MKKMISMLFALAVMIPALALALAGSPVLLVDLPQDAQMIENIAFDDGDFIQTYQLSGGANVQLLRYQAFDMTLGDLIASEWMGATDVREAAVTSVGGYPAHGLRFTYPQENGDALDVTLILVDADGATLVFEAVYPAALGDMQIGAAVEQMIASMDVMEASGAPADESAEVG